MSNDTAKHTEVPDPLAAERIEAGARFLARNHRWDDIGHEVREYYRALAAGAVEAALAGCTVVELPEPAGQDDEITWWLWGNGGRVEVYRRGRHDPDRSVRFRAQAGAMLAAADLADRQVAESSGDGESR